MDEKTNSWSLHSRTKSRHTVKSSSSKDLNNRHPTVVRIPDKIAKSKNLATASSMDNKFVCQNTSRLIFSSVNHQKPLSSQMNWSLPQKSSTIKRINEVVRTTVPKCTHKLAETSEEKTMSITGRFHELSSFAEGTGLATHGQLKQDRKQIRSKLRCGSLHAPTISSTQRLIASRDSKEVTKKCSRDTEAETKICRLNNKGSSISEVIPFVRPQSISVPSRRVAMTVTKSAGSLSTRLSASNMPKDSRTIREPKINDHLRITKPQEHSKRGPATGLQPRGNPIPSSSKVVVSPATFSRLLDIDSSSNRNNICKRGSSRLPTSSPGQGRILSLYDCSAEADSLNYHDQHREMRMNIDDMSYEELLELQEKIGSVSTGLTDEALTKCLKRSNFKLAPSPSGIMDFFDGNGCSICQEECEDGEEIGTLACEHCYHAFCIKQWLRLKNWCPICKAPASADSQLSTN